MATMRTARTNQDSRIPRTREWIVQSFNRLILNRQYDRFDVTEVAERAGVGRSTLYEHFKGKENILRQSMMPVLEVFADAVLAASDPVRLRRTVEHIGTHRPQAHRMLVGPAGPAIVRMQTELVEHRLRGTLGDAVTPGVLPIPLVAAQIAYAQLGLLRAWTERGIEPCTADALAIAMDSSTKALVAAFQLNAAKKSDRTA